MASMKYDIPLLDRNTRFSLWQVKMGDVLTQMELGDALLGFEKMPANWSMEEKQRKDRKATSLIHLHFSNYTAGYLEREDNDCFVAQVGAVMHDKEFDEKTDSKAEVVFPSHGGRRVTA